MREPNRIAPGLQVGSMQTYQVIAPVNTHFRPATCEEVGCSAHARGWVTVLDETTPRGQGMAYYIRKESGRSFKEERRPDGLTEFRFAAGQPCFDRANHRMRIPRPEIFVVRSGDWRGNPDGIRRVHRNGQDWVEDFGEHQERLRDDLRRG